MNLSEIPQGEMVVLDANIVIYSVRNVSRQCRQIFRRCAEQDLSCIMSSQQIAEVMHRLMIAEALDNKWISGSNPARKLSEKPDRIKALHRYDQALRDLFGIGIILQPALREDFMLALSIQRQFGLMTNDALLVACAQRIRCRSIASSDKRLRSVRDIVVYEPDDLEV